MSAVHLRGSCGVVVAALAVAVGLSVVAPSRADDALDRIQVAAQKVATDARGLIASARKVETTDPKQALGHLRVAEYTVEDAKGLAHEQRTQLLREIRQHITRVEAAIRERGRATGTPTPPADLVRDREKEKRRQIEEQPKFGAGGFTDPKKFIKSGRDVLGHTQDLKDRRELGTLAINREVMESAGRMVEERFTKRWEWLQKNRPTQKLTKAEAHLLKMLNSVMSINWDPPTTLKAAIEEIQAKTDISIFVDELSLKELEIEYDSPVKFKANKVTVRTILKKVLADKGLTYVIKEAAIHVMTPDKAKQHIAVRAYAIADLLPRNTLVYANGLPPLLRQQFLAEVTRPLLVTIANMVDPASWQVNGGTGTIMFEPNTLAIVIRAPAEIHYQLGGALGR